MIIKLILISVLSNPFRYLFLYIEMENSTYFLKEMRLDGLRLVVFKDLKKTGSTSIEKYREKNGAVEAKTTLRLFGLHLKLETYKIQLVNLKFDELIIRNNELVQGSISNFLYDAFQILLMIQMHVAMKQLGTKLTKQLQRVVIFKQDIFFIIFDEIRIKKDCLQ